MFINEELIKKASTTNDGLMTKEDKEYIDKIYDPTKMYFDKIVGLTNNLDTTPYLISLPTVDPQGFPSGLGGNGCIVITMANSTSNYNAQLAFGFGSAKIAIRTKYGTSTWSAWKYVTLS